MRRIFAILIVAFVVFWGVFWLTYALVPSAQATINGFALNVVGPTAYNTVSTVYLGVINTVGILGLAAIILVGGFFVGIFTHKLWVGADWRIRRWGADRTRKDLGVSGVSHVSTTPAGATTRPETIVQEVQQTPVPPPTEEKKEEAK